MHGYMQQACTDPSLPLNPSHSLLAAPVVKGESPFPAPSILPWEWEPSLQAHGTLAVPGASTKHVCLGQGSRARQGSETVPSFPSSASPVPAHVRLEQSPARVSIPGSCWEWGSETHRGAGSFSGSSQEEQ